MEITIRDTDDNVILTTLVSDSSKWVKEVMPEKYTDYIEISFITGSYVSILRGHYITVGGTYYTLAENAKPTIDKATGGYRYSLIFTTSVNLAINDSLFCYYVDVATDNKEQDFKLTGTASQFMQLILINIEQTDGRIYDAGTLPDGIKAIRFENLTIKQALDLLAKTYDTEWWFDGLTINLSQCRTGSEIALNYDVELDDISHAQSSKEVFRKIYAYGSTRNIPASYYPVDGSLNVNTTRRLRLPSGTKYVTIDPYEYAPKEGVVIFDEIYPKRVGAITDLRTEVVSKDGIDTIIYIFKDSGLTFNLSYILPGETLKVAFQSGNLNGRDFEIFYHSDTNEYEIIYTNEGSVIPNPVLAPEIGDSYVLYNFDITLVSDEYIETAEQELLTAATNYLNSQEDAYIYELKTRSIYCEQNEVDLPLGQRVHIISDIINKPFLRIRKFEKNLLNSFEATYTVGDSKRLSIIDGLKKKASIQPQIVQIGNIENITNSFKSYYNTGGLSTAENDPVFQAWLSTFVAAVEKSYLSLTDTPNSYAGKAKNVHIVNDAETGNEFMPTTLAKLIHLADFPASLTGHELKLLRINAAGTMVEFITNNFLPDTVKQEIELNDTWKIGNNLYQEFVFTGSDITQINYWSTAAKTLKLFTKDITYTGGNPTTIVLKDEVTGKLLTTTIAYSGSDVLNVTKTVV